MECCKSLRNCDISISEALLSEDEEEEEKEGGISTFFSNMKTVE